MRYFHSAIICFSFEKWLILPTILLHSAVVARYSTKGVGGGQEPSKPSSSKVFYNPKIENVPTDNMHVPLLLSIPNVKCSLFVLRDLTIKCGCHAKRFNHTKCGYARDQVRLICARDLG